MTLVVLLHTHAGMPLEKIATLLRERFGVRVTPDGLVHALHRAARVAAPTYAALREQIRGSPVVSPDETGWRVGAILHWLWAFATPTTTVYAIRPGRAFDDAAAILGADFDGVLVRDGWAPYRQFTQALHRSCVQHLARRCRTLRADHPRSPWAAHVQAVFTDALALRDRRNAGRISAHGVAVARGHLLARLGRLIDTAPALPAATRVAAHLAIEFPAVLGFLWDASVDATNWRAEQAIRPAVVNRKICGGNRTPRGAHTQEVLASVVRTGRQRHVDLTSFFTTDPEPGPLPSTGIDRLPRYCRPLRLPSSPASPSGWAWRAPTTTGLPCCPVIRRDVPSPLPRWTVRALMVVLSRTRRPSPCLGRVGVHDSLSWPAQR